MENPEDEVDVLVYNRIAYDDPENLAESASTTLKADANADKLTVDVSQDGIRVGNTHGLILLDRFRRIERDVGGLKKEVSRLEGLVGRQDNNISDLRKQVADLREAVANYEQHRERFLSETCWALQPGRI